MTFQFILLYNLKETIPWASPEYNFITVLPFPNVHNFRHRKMIRNKKLTLLSESTVENSLRIFVNIHEEILLLTTAIICSPIVIWFKVFISNINHFQTDLFNPQMSWREPATNGHEMVRYILQSFRNGLSPSDPV